MESEKIIKTLKDEPKKGYREYPNIGGIYLHYKGGMYKVLTMSTNEDGEPEVVYRSIQFKSVHNCRLTKWNDTISRDDMKKMYEESGVLRHTAHQPTPRFKFVAMKMKKFNQSR